MRPRGIFDWTSARQRLIELAANLTCPSRFVSMVTLRENFAAHRRGGFGREWITRL